MLKINTLCDSFCLVFNLPHLHHHTSELMISRQNNTLVNFLSFLSSFFLRRNNNVSVPEHIIASAGKCKWLIIDNLLLLFINFPVSCWRSNATWRTWNIYFLLKQDLLASLKIIGTTLGQKNYKLSTRPTQSWIHESAFAMCSTCGLSQSVIYIIQLAKDRQQIILQARNSWLPSRLWCILWWSRGDRHVWWYKINIPVYLNAY